MKVAYNARKHPTSSVWPSLDKEPVTTARTGCSETNSRSARGGLCSNPRHLRYWNEACVYVPAAGSQESRSLLDPKCQNFCCQWYDRRTCSFLSSRVCMTGSGTALMSRGCPLIFIMCTTTTRRSRQFLRKNKSEVFFSHYLCFRILVKEKFWNGNLGHFGSKGYISNMGHLWHVRQFWIQ